MSPGITVAAGGLVALATAPLSAAVIAVTAAGFAVAGAGLFAGHWMNKKKFAHEENADRYSEHAREMT